MLELLYLVNVSSYVSSAFLFIGFVLVFDLQIIYLLFIDEWYIWTSIYVIFLNNYFAGVSLLCICSLALMFILFSLAALSFFFALLIFIYVVLA